MADQSPAAVLAEFLQDQERQGSVFEAAPEAGRAMLLGWVVVSEWIDENGNRWLSQMTGNTEGKVLPDWQSQGYLYNVLNNAEDFRVPGDDEDGDDD